MRTSGMFFFWGDHPVPETPRRSSSQHHKVRKHATTSKRRKHSFSDDSSTSWNSSKSSWSSNSANSSPNCSEAPTQEDVKKQTMGISVELMRLMCFAPEEPETLVITEEQKPVEEETLDEDHIIFFERERGMSGYSHADISYDESFIEDLESRSEYEQPRQRPTTIQVQPKRTGTTQSRDGSTCEDINSKCSYDSDGDSICEPPSELVVSKPNDIESDDDSSISDSSISSEDSSWEDSENDPSFDDSSDDSSDGSSFSGKSTDSEMQDCTEGFQETPQPTILLAPVQNSKKGKEVSNPVLSEDTVGSLCHPVSTVVTLKVSRKDFKSKKLQNPADLNEMNIPANTSPRGEEHLSSSSVVPTCISETSDVESLHLGGGEESQAIEDKSSFQAKPNVAFQATGHQTEISAAEPTSFAVETTTMPPSTPSAVLETNSSKSDEERRTLSQEPLQSHEVKDHEDDHRLEVAHSLPISNPPGLMDKANAVSGATVEELDDTMEMQKMEMIQEITVKSEGTVPLLCTDKPANWSVNQLEKPLLPRHRETYKVIPEEAAPFPSTNNLRSTRLDFLKTVRGVKNAQPKLTTEETSRQREKDITPVSPSPNPDPVQWSARNVRERRRIRMGKLRLARSTKATTP